MKKNLAVVIASLFIVFLVYSGVVLLVPLPFGNQPVEFEIKRGATYRQVVDSLAQRGMVRDRWIFSLLGRVSGIDRKIKAGYYTLWGSMTPWQVFGAIRLGKIVEYEITIIPGDSLREIADKFVALGMTSRENFLTLCVSRDILEAYEVDAPSLEGYLFPDTYRFPKGLDAREVLTMMVNRLRESYEPELMLRMLDMNLTENDILTMASIIEKEAATNEERPVISAVYHNRLRRNMPLQADPTSVYGVKSSKERITKEDIQRKTPYNTYIIRGLPPGPIASPGLESIVAALNPAEAPYLYFVSNNDGTHTFSVTLGEHHEAVRSYRDMKKAKTEG